MSAPSSARRVALGVLLVAPGLALASQGTDPAQGQDSPELSTLFPRGVPPELAPADWFEQVSRRIADQEYGFQGHADGVSAPNRAQGLRVHVDARGLRVESRQPDGPWSLRLETVQVGRAGALAALAPGEVSAQGSRAHIARAQVVEWFENRREGVEQGWNLAQPPAGDASRPVRLRLSSAGLRLHIESPQRGVWVDGRGLGLLHYAGLAAWDAQGRALPVSLSAHPQGCVIELDDRGATYPVTIDPLLTTPAWSAESDQANASFGFSVAGAGDVDMDGYDDVLVGALGYDGGQNNEGRVFLYRGGPGGPATTPDWSFESDQAGANLGTSVAALGDCNADGFGDVVVGAPLFNNGQQNEGRAFVFHGGPGGPSTAPDRTVEGNLGNALFAISVAGVGDVDGDGFDDLGVGAYLLTNNQANEGRAFVFRGSPAGITAPAAWAVEGDQVNSNFGYSISGAGDVNADGFADVLIGARNFDHPENNEGRAYLYFGAPQMPATTADWSDESNQASAGYGHSVAGIGDVDGDGFDDIAVGAYLYDGPQMDEGRVFVYHGSASGPSLVADRILEQDEAGAQFGYQVARAGDVNSDGFADLFVGARFADGGSSDEGSAALFAGSAAGLPGVADVVLVGSQTDENFGTTVAGAGDVNRDGNDDVLVGAPLHDGGQVNEGRALLYLGQGGADCNMNGVGDGADIASGTSQDCNGNGVPDECDTTSGGGDDCDGNGIPDECEADCNQNGVTDLCDIIAGTSQDCNANAIPDECDGDCNGNGLADECDLAAGTSEDCDGNGLPDECDADCNENGVPDACDLAAGSSEDCNANGSPDECDTSGGVQDCNGDGVPDECEPDCNANAVPDACDIASGASRDCNSNGSPDDCDIASGVSGDCDANGIPDVCDIASGSDDDCNTNGVPDACDLAAGATDSNGNGVLDECECSLTSFCTAGVNSAGTRARIGATGSLALADNDFALLVTRTPPNRPGVFFFGGSRLMVPFGDGFRCIGAGPFGQVFRLFPVLQTDASGAAQRPLDFTGGAGESAIVPLRETTFQFWYRDPMGPMGSGFNLTGGLAVSFCP